jgi:hypothetical protein
MAFRHGLLASQLMDRRRYDNRRSVTPFDRDAVLSIRHLRAPSFRHIALVFGNSVLSNRIHDVIFSTPRTGMAVATQRVRRGEFGDFGPSAVYRHAISRESLPERTKFIDTTSARDVVMTNYAGKISIVVPERTNQIFEKPIWGGLITTELLAAESQLNRNFTATGTKARWHANSADGDKSSRSTIPSANWRLWRRYSGINESECPR